MSESAAGFVFELLEREQVLVSYATGSQAKCHDAWDRYFELMEARISPTLRFLVVHEARPPSIREQQRLGSLARPHSPKVALISSSNALRFAVSAFSLINRRIRFFAPDDMDGALRHLEVGEAEKPPVLESMARLRRALGP